jgi:hypothetical protein
MQGAAAGSDFASRNRYTSGLFPMILTGISNETARGLRNRKKGLKYGKIDYFH